MGHARARVGRLSCERGGLPVVGRHARLLAGWALVLGGGLLAGCGSGGTSSAGVIEFPGAAPVGGFTGVIVTARSVVVSADVDGDTLPDLLAVGRDGSGAGAAWRNLGHGTWTPAPASWRELPVVGSLVDDTERRNDTALEDGFAVHQVGRPGHADLPYAVVHVGNGAAAVTAPPVLDAIEPATGAPHALVRLEGSALGAPGLATTVTFGSVAATTLFVFPDLILAVVPDGLPLGATEVRVSRGDIVSGPLSFEVLNPSLPIVTSIVPSTVAPGELAVLRGDHLGTPFDVVEVSFTGASPVSGLGLGSACAVVVPASAVSGPVTVTVEGLASAPFDVPVGARPAPHADALAPASASVGSLVRIEGTDLLVPSEALTVTFAGVRAAIYSVDETSLTVIVPTGAADGDVIVQVGGRASNPLAFDVVARGVPHIGSVTPASGRIGDLVDITGSDLIDLSAWKPGRLPPIPLFGDLKVSVGGKDAWFVLPSADGLRVVVPSGATSAGIVVTVHGVASTTAAYDVH